MAKKINYTGSSKILIRICEAINDVIEHGGGGGGMSSTTATLLAANWVGNTIPYTYDLGETYADMDIIIGYDSSSLDASDTTMAAAANAKIVGGEATTIYAYGVKPTVDIPIIIIYG